MADKSTAVSVIYQNKTLNTASLRPSGASSNRTPSTAKVPDRRIAIDNITAVSAASGAAPGAGGRASATCEIIVTANKAIPLRANHVVSAATPRLTAIACKPQAITTSAVPTAIPPLVEPAALGRGDDASIDKLDMKPCEPSGSGVFLLVKECFLVTAKSFARAVAGSKFRSPPGRDRLCRN